VLLAPHPSAVPPWPADCGCQPAPTRCLPLQPHLAAGAWRPELEYYAAAARSRGQSQVAHVQVFSWIGGEACDVATGDDTTARGWGGGGDDGRRGGVRIMKGLTQVD
jgi:hypothetical protein